FRARASQWHEAWSSPSMLQRNAGGRLFMLTPDGDVNGGRGRRGPRASARHKALLHRLASVDDQGVPDDEGGRIRAEPDDGRGDLLGLAHPADRLLRDYLRAPLGRAAGEAPHHRGVDVPGADGVDAEVLPGVVEG